MERRNIAVEPASRPAMQNALVAAVRAAGGEVVSPSEASALILADPAAAADFQRVVADAPEVEWIQLCLLYTSPSP